MKGIFATIILTLLVISLVTAQDCYWQQAINYEMEIDVDAKKNQYKGKQTVTYTNNSPDTLDRIFYHLYFNAFQPNSMMDVRSRTILDADRRVGDRISKLTKDEVGYQVVKKLELNGQPQEFVTEGTILEVQLTEPILPGATVELYMEHKAQVPLQIRRSGRDNKEGVRFSMSQWYPKVCEYDHLGWHANPYVGREFHGVWGDFDVKITIDKDYILGAGGQLVNAEDIGYGYHTSAVDISKKKKLTWHWRAENVHDFFWAADPDYVHTTYQTDEGVLLHMLYQPGENTTDNWTELPRIMDAALDFMNEKYGEYPYPSYAFVQGGDGGMEYPMGTLITGERSISSLVGVSVHEWMHSWYQMVLATNEALYPYMDEGFTSFGSSETMNYLRQQGLIPGEVVDNPAAGAVASYAGFALSGYEEPLVTHADHYQTNQAYGVGSYVKGQAMLAQLRYIMGTETFDKALKRYYNTWKFKHPTVERFIREMEYESDLELDWFREYYVHTTHVIDYGIDSVYADGKTTKVDLARYGTFPMPQEVEVTFVDGSSETFYLPLRVMRGTKDFVGKEVTQLSDWPWTHPTRTIEIDRPLAQIRSITIAEDSDLADVDESNNRWPKIMESNEE